MILPEVDGPAHTANGFQWGTDANLGELVLCTDPLGKQGADWTLTALGPPSGQLNIANENIYPIFNDIYRELSSAFGPLNYFHVGGDELIVGSDEVTLSCYNNSKLAAPLIQLIEEKGMNRNDPNTFYSLWNDYNKKIAGLVDVQFPAVVKKHIWGGAGDDPSGIAYNMMTRPNVTDLLPPSKYNIQVWDTSVGSIVPELLGKGYSVVLSNTDYVYLDCGNAGWAHPGGYWCQPYHEWQKIYEYVSDVQDLWELNDAEFRNVLGSETLAWSEMIDANNVEQKIWPRTAALAEALWGRTAEKGSSWYAADPRMQQWTRTLVQRGIQAEPLQTEWCGQREAYACTINAGQPQ